MSALPPGIRRIVVTGFGPFGDNSSNPSRVAAAAMAAAAPNRVRFEELPVVFADVDVWPRQQDPAVLHLHLGLAASAKVARVETRACNQCGVSPDNSGVAGPPVIRPGSPEVLAASWSLEPLRLALQTLMNEVVELSTDCGDYVCNFTLYVSLLDAPDRAVFVHLPPMSDECAQQWGRALAAATEPSASQS